MISSSDYGSQMSLWAVIPGVDRDSGVHADPPNGGGTDMERRAGLAGWMAAGWADGTEACYPAALLAKANA